MTDSINNFSRVIGEIAVSSEEQSSGIQQVRMAVNEIDRITQQKEQPDGRAVHHPGERPAAIN